MIKTESRETNSSHDKHFPNKLTFVHINFSIYIYVDYIAFCQSIDIYFVLR